MTIDEVKSVLNTNDTLTIKAATALIMTETSDTGISGLCQALEAHLKDTTPNRQAHLTSHIAFLHFQHHTEWVRNTRSLNGSTICRDGNALVVHCPSAIQQTKRVHSPAQLVQYVGSLHWEWIATE